MSITLGGIDLGNDFYLSGLESASLVAVEEKRTLNGTFVVGTTPTPGGRKLELTTQSRSATIGLWCLSVIEQVKDLEILGLVLDLDYHGTSYKVIISSTSYEPFFEWEKESPTKAFTGKISLIEV